MRNRIVVALPVVWLALMLAAPLSAGEVERGPWQERMVDELPKHFCAEGTYFRECFRVSQDRCLRVARASTRDCLEQHADDIPARIQLPEQGRSLGRTIGSCAGRVYEEALERERRLTRTCRNPDAWR